MPGSDQGKAVLPTDLPSKLHYKEVAAILKVSPLTIQRLIAEKNLPSQDGVYIHRLDLDDYLEHNSTINTPLI